MSQSTIDGNVFVRGLLGATKVNLPPACIGDGQANPSDPIGADKLQHQHCQRYSQAKGTAVAAVTGQVLHTALGDGTVLGVRAGVLVAAVGDSTVSVVVKRNGSSILTGSITITSSQAAYDLVDGVVNVADYVAADVFEVAVTPTAGTGTLPQGLFLDLVLREAAS